MGRSFYKTLNLRYNVEHVISKARKIIPITKRLARVKWGNRETLITNHKIYIHLIPNYSNEVLISSSENIFKFLDTFQTQMLRLIAGGGTTTPVLGMQLLCNQLIPFDSEECSYPL